MTDNGRIAAAASLALACAIAAGCLGGERAMYRYYRNHPAMLRRLLAVRTIHIEDVRDAADGEEALLVKDALAAELDRRGKGRFRLAADAADADAVLQAEMTEALGPVTEEEPLPFEIEPRMVVRRGVFLRIRLVDPKTGDLIYKTDTREFSEIAVDSVEKAAFTVVSNLMREIGLARRALRPHPPAP
ncbi:MAG: hypothetical protein PHN82_02015 [bacterium]|nr:hypothetical protein [bacterium]